MDRFLKTKKKILINLKLVQGYILANEYPIDEEPKKKLDKSLTIEDIGDEITDENKDLKIKKAKTKVVKDPDSA
jgi:hypothetical protein